jgi:S-adenosylmethionine:tRNA ribosyltransferase-isomerase
MEAAMLDSGAMRVSDFDYPLPPGLIAQTPLDERSASRLLVLDRAGSHDRQFLELPDLLAPGDLLVCNDTRVLPARLYGHKDTGGRAEALIERLLDDHTALAQLHVSKPPRPGARLHFEGDLEAEVIAREGEFWCLHFHDPRPLPLLLEAHGHVPLPPYITRRDTAGDRARYQTVFARTPGAVAAPTAGLHLDAALLERLEARGIGMATVTLHVGAGTFQPLRVEDPAEHRMHAEYVEVGAETCARIHETRARGGRVVCVGTTVVRSLESAAQSGTLAPFSGLTQLFIRPGYRFHCVDSLITNFHLPRSTLLMLVCAFGGYDAVMAAYHHAIEQRYRFFSYGDAMLILGRGGRAQHAV